MRLSAAARRFGAVYRTLAVIVLNTLLLLLLVEGAAALVLAGREIPREEQVQAFKDKMLRLEYYYGQDWSKAYWDEHMQAVDHWAYRPYRLWQTRPFNGQFINVDELGRRATPGSDCAAQDRRVFAFGGSTMWGYGVPDWGTIPAYLQAGLDDACVVSYGEMGFNSTQSLIRLIERLQAGDVPDVVIFYDGSNDVTAAHRSSRPGAHFSEEAVAPAVENALNAGGAGVSPLRALVTNTAIYRLLAGAAQAGPDWALPPFAPGFVDGVADTYLNNLRAASALAREYGFAFYAFLQPVLPLAGEPANAEQQMFLWDMPGGLPELFRAVYPRWMAAAESLPYLYNLSDVLDGQPYPVWIDFNHLTPWGNLAVADAMLKVIRPAMSG
ncbi:MAG: hypothetical protein HXY41_16945 [Chloroflexi bacterium]|nr:hypothetical protein [Chloroflexota bacterium]